MKIAVRYQSRNGNTKEVAEVIAKTIGGISAESIDKPIAEPVDVLFIGGGVYMHDIEPVLKEYLEKLDPNLIKSVAAFTTAGTQDGTERIAEIAKNKGIFVHNDKLALKLFLKNHSKLGGKGVLKLNKKQTQKIKDFVNNIITI